MASEREKLDKPKGGNSIKHIPKDAQVIMSILKDLGVADYEPRVINQLLEFTYRYVTCILDDAKIYANHAKKKTIDLDDVKLASQMTLEKAFTGPPPRDVLLELARGRNIAALPLIKPHCGLRLPPDRYCLVAPNYKLRSVPIQQRKLSKSALDRTTAKGIRPPTVPPVKRQANNAAKTVVIPRPVIKFSGEATVRSSSSNPKQFKIQIQPSSMDFKTALQLEPDIVSKPSTSGGGVKRKLEEDPIEFDPQ